MKLQTTPPMVPGNDPSPEPLVTVAIVDDQSAVAECFGLYLSTKGGYAVPHLAASGQEFVQRCGNDPATHMVLVEVHLAAMRGAEVIQWVRVHWPTALVLAMSADRSPEAMRVAVQAGAHGFFPKQATGTELLEALERLQRKGSYFNDALLKDHLAQTDAATPAKQLRTLNLTPQEMQVLEAVCAPDEPTWEQVAERIHKSLATVHTHRNNLFGKTGTKSKAGLVSFGHALNYGTGMHRI